jgi:hypothetical protein
LRIRRNKYYIKCKTYKPVKVKTTELTIPIARDTTVAVVFKKMKMVAIPRVANAGMFGTKVLPQFP